MKESNCSDIVNSKEFESLDKPLMVEIIRRKLTPPPHARLVAETHNEAVISTSHIKNSPACTNSITRYWSIKVVIVMKKKEVKKFITFM